MKQVLIGMLCLLSTVIFGQQFNAPSNPSANASAIAQYGHVPVSHFTGVPNISVPVGRVQEGSLGIDVSLSYHASGIKVDQLASWVGLGWNLNAGGAIVRYVNGKKDENGWEHGGLHHSLESSSFLWDYYHYDYTDSPVFKALDKQIDSEPDSYIFNFNGLTGKFFLNESGEPTLVTTSDLIIRRAKKRIVAYWGYVYQEAEPGDWVIISPDGTKYYFGGLNGTERTYTYRSENVDRSHDTETSTTWYLIKVESFDEANVINLTYDSEYYSYANLPQRYVAFTPNGGFWSGKDMFSSEKTIITDVKGKRLTSIYGKSGSHRIDFVSNSLRTDLNEYDPDPVAAVNNSAKYLNEIRIKVNGIATKNFSLNHDYFNQSFNSYAFRKLRLKSVQEKSPNGIGLPATSFEYWDGFLPYRLSYARDHWGYYNGKNQNRTLFPKGWLNPITNIHSTSSAEADRNPNLLAARTGTLKKINHPTGGSTGFNYELHQLDDGSQLGGLRIESIKNYNSDNALAKSTNYSYGNGVALGGKITPSSYTIFQTSTNKQSFPPAAFITTYPKPALENSLIGTHIGYSKVTESMGGDGRTEYYFKNGLGNTQTNYPYTPVDIQPEIGVMEKSLSFNGTSNIPFEETHLTYTKTLKSTTEARKVSLYNFAYPVSINGSTGGASFYHPGSAILAQSKYYLRSYKYVLDSKRTVLDGVETIEKYKYSDKHHSPISESIVSSDGTLYETKKEYGPDLNNTTLTNQNRIATPLQVSKLVNGVIQGKQNVFYKLFDGNYRPWKIYRYGYNNTLISSHAVNSYNEKGMPLSFGVDGDIPTSIIYDKNGYRPVANITNAQTSSSIATSNLNESAFSSFEGTNSAGGWSYNSANIESGNAVLGSKAYRLNSAIQKYVPSGNYIMAFWVKGQGTLKAGNQSVVGTNEWTYYEVPINNSTLAKIYQTIAYTPPSNGPKMILRPLDDDYYDPSGGIVDPGDTYSAPTHASYLFLDEVRLFPADAQMSTYTYNDNGTLDGQADINGVITSYDYDEFYRLKNVKDKNGNIVSAHKYGNPVSGKHWVSKFIPQEAYLSNYTFDNLGADKVHRTTSYVDGLGRPFASEANGMSPSGIDVISFNVYDEYGKMPKEYMSYTGTFNENTSISNHIASSINFYKGLYGNTEGQYAYTQKVYESDISGRVVASSIPGIHHKIDDVTKIEESRAVKSHFRSNKYILDSDIYDFGLGGGGTYADNKLSVTQITDPDGVVTQVFTDNMGRKVMEKRAGLRTYYIYDLRSNLIGVLPPETTKKARNNRERFYSAIKRDFGDEMYWYEYDNQNRLITKHIPGADPVSYGYDDLDRPIWTLDGNGNKTYQEYDLLSRPTKSGIYNGSTKVLHKEFYYDNYNHASGQQFISKAGYDAERFGFTRGQTTGSSTKVLDGGNTFLKSSAYYDEFYRPIYTVTENHAGGYDQLWSKYDFNGRELETFYYQEAYPGLNQYQTTIESRSEYDHAGRLLKTFKSINGEPEINTASLTYNEVGDVVSKSLHKDGAAAPWATETYVHSIRGNLIKQQAKKANGQELYYQYYYYNNQNHYGSYSGNMFRTLWRADGGSTKRYDFLYDTQYRLTKADYRVHGQANSMNYDVRNLSYDDNGNIAGLQRYDESGVIMDNLTMQYTVDRTRLSGVTESSSTTKGFVRNGSGNYQYDSNGNLTRDPYKQVDIIYNHFDTPVSVSNDDANKGDVTWVYDADGNTLSMQSSLTGSSKRLYVNGFEYYGGVLESVIFEEGRIKFCDGGQNVEYEYHLIDHLGNTRVAFTEVNGQIRINQENHFYPFGMEMEGSWNNVYCADNKYKYNGIEKVEEAGLDNYFAFYRSLDPSIGRWWQVDPKAEKYMSLNAYVSMNNNPISMSDPNGDTPLIGAGIGFLTNGISNLFNGENFFKGALQATFMGALGGGVADGIGNMGLNTIGQASMHGLTGGMMSQANGGSFGSGFLSGALSSGISSGAQALNVGNVGMIAAGGLSGGLGSVIGGGNFLDGLGQGLITSGLNHAAHQIDNAFKVDKELEAKGLEGGDQPAFNMESVETVQGLPSVKKLELLAGRNKASIHLVAGESLGNYDAGHITLYSKQFKTWRRLATAYGHEMAHHVAHVQLYRILKNQGMTYGRNLPKHFTESMAYYWSSKYSGEAQQRAADNYKYIKNSRYNSYYLKYRITP